MSRNRNQAQRGRILEWLRSESLTTLQAREHLDIMHPAGRVKELKAQGHDIKTEWAVEHTAKGKHRVGRYVLLMGGVV